MKTSTLTGHITPPKATEAVMHVIADCCEELIGGRSLPAQYNLACALLGASVIGQPNALLDKIREAFRVASRP